MVYFSHKVYYERFFVLKRFTALFLAVLTAFSLVSCGVFRSEEDVPTKPAKTLPAPTAQTVDTTPQTLPAPEPVPTPSGPVALIDGTTTAMMAPSFWNCSDELVADEAKIAEINEANTPAVMYYDKSGALCSVKIADVGETLPGDTVYCIITDNAPSGAYVDHAPMPDGYYTALDANRNTDAIPETVAVRYAVCTRRTMGYIYPTDDFITDEAGDYYYNNNAESELMPAQAVIVLHVSADGEWAYVLADTLGAWVREDALAYCADRAEWEAAKSPEDFLLITGNNVTLDVTPMPSAASAMALPMGTKLRLSDPIPTEVGGRRPISAFSVELPVREDDGSLGYETALVPISLDVHVGYLPLTSRGVITQAFKFLGHVYGWGGSFGSNDCSGFAKQIYSCFGVNIPRNSKPISEMTGLLSGDFTEGEPDGARLEKLASLTPGAILFFPGHIMIYIGTVDGVPYTISSLAMYIPASQAGQSTFTVDTVNTICITPMTVLSSGITWYQKISRYVDLKV